MKKYLCLAVSVLLLSSSMLLASCTTEPAEQEQEVEATPELTPEATAEPTPEPTPEATVEPTPEPTPEGTPRPEKTGLYYPGEYTAKATGYGGYVIVTITVDDNTITDININGEHETSYIGGIAIDEMPEKILEAQSADVDVTSGATHTADAIKEAFNLAIADAKGE